MKRQLKTQARRVIRKIKASSDRGASNRLLPPNLPCTYSVDNPIKSLTDKKIITVDGWLIPNDKTPLKSIRALHDNKHIDIGYGVKRADVAKAFPQKANALMSGFHAEIEIVDGPLVIEADFGDGYKRLHSIDMRYSPERLVSDVYNPKLAENYAEHINLLENKTKYYYEDAMPGNYQRAAKDPRLVAFYLPQFHPIEENNHVWGKGFTEWTNVTNDTPRFVGHRQPILPKDTGFYDLRLENNMLDQITMAKKHGIFGFCFYYYWFSGRRLLEKPLEGFLKHPEWDFNFTICWANENWTKRWDGRDSEVIVAQKYADDDPLTFIKDVEDILLDPRYIKEDGKPVLLVFRASELKRPQEYADTWRNYFRKTHGTDLHLISIVSFEDKDPREYGFDAALDFAPQSSFFKNECFEDKRYPYVNVDDNLIDVNFAGSVADYRSIALTESTYEYFKFPTYKCVTPSWDNDARKKGKGFVMFNESPDVYAQWLENVLTIETKKNSSPMVFVNAWNEWAEGAILEPTAHYGHAVLNKTSEVLAKHSTKKANQDCFPAFNKTKKTGTDLAVVLHLYYPERWEFIKEKLELLSDIKYDLFVTINQKDADFVAEITAYNKNVYVKVVPNRGRDILPFMYLAPKLSSAGYKYVLKLHSKKSLHRSNGQDWFEQLLNNLIPSRELVNQALKSLQAGTASMIGPGGHFISLEKYMGSNEPHLKNILTKAYSTEAADSLLARSSRTGYFAGSMFWLSLDSIAALTEQYYMPEDFESERGQIDGTMAHALERTMTLALHIQSKPLYSIDQNSLEVVKEGDATTQYGYAE